jgi:hypothetical protein
VGVGGAAVAAGALVAAGAVVAAAAVRVGVGAADSIELCASPPAAQGSVAVTGAGLAGAPAGAHPVASKMRTAAAAEELLSMAGPPAQELGSAAPL